MKAIVLRGKRWLCAMMLLTMVTAVNGQCRYCNTHEDFLEGRWTELDTVYCETFSKSQQMWWGCNDYAFTTGDKDTDKILKKKAFVVMKDDTLYVNCRNLRYDKDRFGSGYTKAKRIGQRSLLFVNRAIGSDIRENHMLAAFMFGAIGSAIDSHSQMKHQVCYVISWGADEKGRISIRMINDDLMEQMIGYHNSLNDEYFSEKDASKRVLAEHVIPILEKAGLFGQSL